jgi:hypothetical protein
MSKKNRKQKGLSREALLMRRVGVQSPESLGQAFIDAILAEAENQIEAGGASSALRLPLNINIRPIELPPIQPELPPTRCVLISIWTGGRPIFVHRFALGGGYGGGHPAAHGGGRLGSVGLTPIDGEPLPPWPWPFPPFPIPRPPIPFPMPFPPPWPPSGFQFGGVNIGSLRSTQKLSREYLAQRRLAAHSPESFGRALVEKILQLAEKRLGDGEVDELALELPVQVSAFEVVERFTTEYAVISLGDSAQDLSIAVPLNADGNPLPLPV